MKHTELRNRREALGLSVAEAAVVLETDVTSVRRMERDPSQKTARPAPARVAQLYAAYEEGFRPANWPDTALSAHSDGRPCPTDVFLVHVKKHEEDHYDLQARVDDWLHGDWDAALADLPELGT